MTFILQSPSGSVYPYSLSMLREEHPNIALSSNPTPQDLEPFNVYPVQLVDQPEVDPRTQIVTEGAPILTGENQWVQTWDVRPATAEEIEQWDAANPATPNWAQFKNSLLVNPNVNQALVAALPLYPTAVIAIPAALMDASSGDWADFRSAWLLLRRAGAIPQQVLDATTALALACNLPEAFRSFLGGATPE